MSTLPGLDPLAERVPLSPVAESIIRFCLCALLGLITTFTCVFVLRHRRRLIAMAYVRVLLCLAVLLWISSAFVARRSLWDVVLPTIGISPSLPAHAVELLCAVDAVLEYGVFEPLTLSLIGLIFHTKSKASAATPWRVWRLVRLALGITLAVALLQAGPIVAHLYGVHPVIFGPQPAINLGSSSMPAASPAPPTLPMPPTVPPATPSPPSPPPLAVQMHPWWRAEGCAATYFDFAISALFQLGFVLVWTVACARLATSMRNHKLRGRLRWVQAVFTLAPSLLVLVRGLLLVVPTSWPTTRRVLRDVELLVIVVAGMHAVHALVLRPVLEAAPVLDRPLHVTAASTTRLNARLELSTLP